MVMRAPLRKGETQGVISDRRLLRLGNCLARVSRFGVSKAKRGRAWLLVLQLAVCRDAGVVGDVIKLASGPAATDLAPAV